MLRKPACASVSDSAGAPESAEAAISRFGGSLAKCDRIIDLSCQYSMSYYPATVGIPRQGQGHSAPTAKVGHSAEMSV